MKVIHLSDTHILNDNSKLFRIDEASTLELALNSIQKNHKDLDFIVITGDLTNSGKSKAYLKLKKILDKYSFPIHLILGNHDKKSYFNRYFDICKKEKFVQYTIKSNAKVFIFLDTSVKNEHYGALCKDRLLFLKNELLKYKNKKVYVFMHHFPINSKLKWMEKHSSFSNKKEFWDIILKHNNVQHIFTGHLHRVINANYKGVGISCAGSTNYQVAYTPNSVKDYLNQDIKPSYDIIDISSSSILIHHHDFLNEEKIFVYKDR